MHSLGDLKKDSSGRPYQQFGTTQDITDRKRGEEALRRSQFYLSEGQRLAHMGSWAAKDLGIRWTARKRYYSPPGFPTSTFSGPVHLPSGTKEGTESQLPLDARHLSRASNAIP